MIALTQSFTEHLLARNYSPATVQDYGYTLKDFIGFLLTREVSDVRGITPALIGDYQVYRLHKLNVYGQPCGVGSRNNTLKAVKCFCAFLQRQGHIGDNPARDIDYAKKPHRLPRNILTPAEMRRLLRTPDSQSALGIRDRCIMELLYSSGLRNKELRNLKLTDLNLEEGVLQVIDGKGHKDRYVPVGKVACRHLAHYIAHVRPMLANKREGDHVFLSIRGKPLGKLAVIASVERYLPLAGIKKTITPHSFRHTCATHLLQNKANLRHIQEILGHASVLSTQIYTSVTIQELKDAHNACHPRNLEVCL